MERGPKHCFGRTAAGLAYLTQDLQNRVYERGREGESVCGTAEP